MKRIKFEKGKQRKFLKLVLEKINCPSLRELIKRGYGVNYSTLKNYFTEKRTLPKNVFEELCELAKIDSTKLKIIYLEKNWGQIKGGKISKK
ncbi:MAG: hypothetical protein ABFQ65_02120 [Nanoarchaeota archaeon]